MSNSYSENILEAFLIAITSLPVETLHSECARIENSIEHLLQSNREIEKYIGEIEDQDEKVEMEDVIESNELVINTQKQKIEMIRSEIKQRSLKI